MEGQTCSQNVINNDFYETLNDSWYEETEHPVALLRAENRIRSPWIQQVIKEKVGDKAHILDIGCGAGFLSNDLARAGHMVTGIDISVSSLETAKKYDTTKSATYLEANAYSLPFEQESYDVVCALDVIEHVDDYTKLIQEGARVLKRGGLFFFHTFNKNLISYILIIKGVDWFVQNAPKNMHVYDLFVSPKDLRKSMQTSGVKVEKIRGLRPKFCQRAFLQLLLRRTVDEEFAFTFSNSLTTGYVGYGCKSR